MIEIDGAIGYGQVLRSAIALSALTLNPIKIINIRKGRPKPGLMAQHLTGVKIAGEFCNAEIKGLNLGSTEIEFIPKSFNISDRKIDIGTAGSISLLLQTLTPLLIFSDEPITLEIVGGTDVKWSPTTTYFQHIFCDFLKRMGADIHMETLKYGFYPKGGGKVRITYKPMEKLKSLNLTERGDLMRINAWSIASENLKKAKVAERQVEGLKRTLKKELTNANIIYTTTLSTGSSLHAHAHYENCKIGTDSLGEKEKPAEKVGEESAKSLIKSIESKAALDKFMSDQIIPFIALADFESRITVEDITQHCLTNIKVCEDLLGVRFEIDHENKEIKIKGIGYKKG